MNTPMTGITQTVEVELFDRATGKQLIRTDDPREAANIYQALTHDGYSLTAYTRTVIEERKVLEWQDLMAESWEHDEKELDVSGETHSPEAVEAGPRMAPLVRNPKPRKIK